MPRAASLLLPIAVLMGGCSFREFWLNSHNERMNGEEAPALADGVWVQPATPPATGGKWRLLAFFVPD
ncbi:MAG: hypothetical protein ACYTF8_15190 [Planctomycetota bacterium]